jgi:hypothetical protein
MACDAIQARTSLTFQQVTRCESLNGCGNVPALTLRQRVGAENGKSAGRPGRFGLCTSCDSRMNALSAKSSNDGITLLDLDGGELACEASCFDLCVRDIFGYLLS